MPQVFQFPIFPWMNIIYFEKLFLGNNIPWNVKTGQSESSIPDCPVMSYNVQIICNLHSLKTPYGLITKSLCGLYAHSKIYVNMWCCGVVFVRSCVTDCVC